MDTLVEDVNEYTRDNPGKAGVDRCRSRIRARSPDAAASTRLRPAQTREFSVTKTPYTYPDPPSEVDDTIDELMPAGFDWQDLVRRYPLAALGLAALGGYVLGRHRGREILEAFAGFAADSVTEQVNQTIGRDVL